MAKRDDELLEAAEAGDGEKKEYTVLTQLFDELTTNANRRIADKMNEVMDRKPYERDSIVTQQLGIKYSTMYYISTYKRSFPLDRLGAFCEKFAGMSCHELTLGEVKPVILPKLLTHMVKGAMQLNNVEGFIDSLINTYKVHIQPVPTLPTRPLLCSERIHELSDDLQLPPKRAQIAYWGKANNIALMFSGTQKVTLIRRVDDRRTSHVKMTSALMLTYLLDVPLDYLVCEDYTRTCPIAYKDNEGNVIPITDKRIIRLVSIYLSLSDEMKKKMFADISLRTTLFKTMFASIPSI